MPQHLTYGCDVRGLDALGAHERGEVVVCPKCHSELVFAGNWQSARAMHVHPGIYCPADHAHVAVLFELDGPERLLDNIAEKESQE